MYRTSSHLQARAFRSLLLAGGLAALILLSLVGAAGACQKGSSSRSVKAPTPAPVSRSGGGSSPSTSVPGPAPSVKACPASTRYNPKTGRCDRYRF
jgi:hypothetical protein